MAALTIAADLRVQALAVVADRPPLQLKNYAGLPTLTTELAHHDLILRVRNTGNLSPAQITDLITTGLAPYATKTYVTGRDALNASFAYIDAGDATRLKISDRTGGTVVPLDASGQVDIARVPGSSTQRWPRLPYTPAAYPAAAVSANTAEVTLFTHTIANPGFSYRLLISGQIDSRTAVDGDAPQIKVRLGSTLGPVLASGVGRGAQYRYGVDTFNRTAPTLGGAWEETYTGDNDGHAATDGSKAYWVPGAIGVLGNNFDRRGIFRRVAGPATTADDYQEVAYKVATPPEAPGLGGAPSRNRLYGRMNNAHTSYVAFDMTAGACSLLYAQNGTETNLVGAQSFDQSVGDEILAQFGYFAASNKRRFRLLRNGAVAIDYTDSGSTAMGSEYRYWGFGMRQGVQAILGVPTNPCHPAYLDWVALYDPLAPWSADPENYSPVVLTPADLSSQAALVGAQTLYVTLRATTTGPVYATTTAPRLHVTLIPA